jgi:uncharacterized membrane protein
MPAVASTKGDAAHTEALVIPLRSFRLESVDLLRGIVMILMALDHTRDFLGITGVNPTDPAQTTIPLFFTRWITHFCAPVFFLLTGTGRVSVVGQEIQAPVVAILIHTGLVADLFGANAVSLLGDSNSISITT